MFQLLGKREYERITTGKAEKYLALNTFPCQRPLDANNLANLINEIRNGTFRTGEIAFAELKYNGNSHVLMNGQHQLRAVLSTGQAIIAHVETWICYDPEDTSLLYRSFDNHKPRSFGNVVQVEAQALGIKWPTRTVQLTASVAAFLQGKAFAVKNIKVTYLKDYLKQGTFLHELIDEPKKEAKHLKRFATAVAIFGTWEKHHEHAKLFWTRVRDGEDLKASMPEYKLRNYLLQITVFKGMGARINTVRKPATPHEIISKCITAWNATRKGITTDLKYFAEKPIPKII